MDPHERFVKHRTAEVTDFLIRTSGDSRVLISLVKACKTSIQDQYKYADSLRSLETLRTVLCSFYQQKITPNLHKDLAPKFDKQFKIYPFNEINVDEIQKSLYTQLSNSLFRHWVEVYLVLDILVLHMLLYSNETAIWIHLEKLQDVMNLHLIQENDIQLLDKILMNCYMDSLLLHQRISQSTDKQKGDKVSALYLKNVHLWLTVKDYKDSQILTLLLPKLIKLIPGGDILTKIWKLIFELKHDSGNTLSMLCQTADIWFPIESNCDEALIDQIMIEPLWLLLVKGLSSPEPQQRKETLYLLKRVVDFADKHKTLNFKLYNYREVEPLICIGNEFQQGVFKTNLNNFFSILEALEKKQKHLITPLFGHFTTLLDASFDQANREAGLHIAWIRCAFMRILHHDDKDVIKWGLINGFRLDPELYNAEFLSTVLDSLNHTYLYENHSNQEEPTVIKELTTLLSNAETKNSDLVSRFVVKASKMTWDPVALYYVIHALSRVERVSSIWQELELEVVKSLAEIDLNMNCRLLCIGSQIELLEVLTHFATESLDLVAVANTLCAFSTSEALIRGQLSWNRISTWLAKIVKEEEALAFIEKICEQLKVDDFPENLTMKSFSLMIMFFHDGHLILNSKLCPGLITLSKLLQCLIGSDCRPYANANLRTKSTELISHLLGFTTSEDYVLRELISNYVDVTLRLAFKNLRKTFDEAFVTNIDAYVSITHQVFTAECPIISKREVLNYIERFEVESWNIIEDGEFSNNVQRLFGIKILYACLSAASGKHRNYKFIGPLCNTYKTLKMKSPEEVTDVNKSSDKGRNLAGKFAAEYYKIVADLFHEYLKDQPADDWIPDINWIEQVLYLIQVGGEDIFVSLVGILSQLFYKGAIREKDIDNIKSAIRLCWESILQSNKCQLALEEMAELIFSSPFLECKETRELTMECIREMLDKADKIPGLSITLVKGLKQAKAEYLSEFYDAILFCLLGGTDPTGDQIIELQTRSYVLDCYQEEYPNYLSDMNPNTNAVIRAHAVTLLHKMITDDPTHAAKLLSLIIVKLDESQNEQCFGDSKMHLLQIRIMQVLLILQPMLEQDDIQSLYLLMCNNMLSKRSQPIVRIMQEWLLIRIYLESETLRAKIWDLFNQKDAKRVGSLCSIVSIVYHVAQSLSSDLQLEFINLAFQYIMPFCMAQQPNIHLYAQIVVSKLYDLAADMSYSTVTEKYKEFCIVSKQSLKNMNLTKNSIKLQDELYFMIFDPIDDYSLETLFYDLPKLSQLSLDEYIPSNMFEKFGFKELNSHPLKLLNLKNDMNKAQASAQMLKSFRSAGSVAGDIDSSEDSPHNIHKKFILSNKVALNKVSEIFKTGNSPETSSTEGRNNIILVASLIDELPSLSGLSRTCKKLGVEEFVVSSIKHTEAEEFQSFSSPNEKLIRLVEVKQDQLQKYLLEKKEMGYQLVGAEQTVNSTNLMDMMFDQKTVLLLGNEKAGIPANLIHLLHECIEIPQVGGVGSLDVNVTGGICLWEYFKQHY